LGYFCGLRCRKSFPRHLPADLSVKAVLPARLLSWILLRVGVTANLTELAVLRHWPKSAFFRGSPFANFAFRLAANPVEIIPLAICGLIYLPGVCVKSILPHFSKKKSRSNRRKEAADFPEALNV
jgi:hypothetical protein